MEPHESNLSFIHSRKRNDPLLVRANGGPWGKIDHGRVLEEVFAEAKIRLVLTFHELRYTYAVMLLRAGVDLPAAAKVLGHADKDRGWDLTWEGDFITAGLSFAIALGRALEI